MAVEESILKGLYWQSWAVATQDTTKAKQSSGVIASVFPIFQFPTAVFFGDLLDALLRAHENPSSDDTENNDQAHHGNRSANLNRWLVQDSGTGRKHIVTSGPREPILRADSIVRLENHAC